MFIACNCLHTRTDYIHTQTAVHSHGETKSPIYLLYFTSFTIHNIFASSKSCSLHLPVFAHSVIRALCVRVHACVVVISVLTEELLNRADRDDHYVEWDDLCRKVCLEIALICIWLNLNHKHTTMCTHRHTQFIDMQWPNATSDKETVPCI